MTPSHFTRIVLNERPIQDIEPKTFRKETVPYESLKYGDENRVVIQVTWLSLDPAMRGYLRDTRNYLPPVQIGEVMRSAGIGLVVEVGSKVTKFKVGDNVSAAVGWQEYAVMDAKNVQKIEVPPGAQALDFLNTLGFAGLTAYFGLKDVGQLKAGEVLVVSGAAGAVGSLACQLGKQGGAKVYAIAGSQEKCEWLEKELGVDKALNYKSPTFVADLKSVGYLDVYFDNVGGDILDLCLTRLKQNARIVMCGAISQYNSVKPKGLQNYMNIISQRVRMQGFIILDYVSEFPAAIQELSRGLSDGSIKRKFHIIEGLDQAPAALPMLFNGGNTGKLVVKVTDVGLKSKM